MEYSECLWEMSSSHAKMEKSMRSQHVEWLERQLALHIAGTGDWMRRKISPGTGIRWPRLLFPYPVGLHSIHIVDVCSRGTPKVVTAFPT